MSRARVTILVDNREKTPWIFPGYPVRMTTLTYGDYSALGLKGLLEIERKSAMDLFLSLVSGQRYPAFLRKMERWERKCARRLVVVEASLGDVLQSRYCRFMHRDVFLHRLGVVQLAGLQVLFAGSPRQAAELVAAMLQFEFEHRERHGEALTAAHIIAQRRKVTKVEAEPWPEELVAPKEEPLLGEPLLPESGVQVHVDA